MRKWVGQYDERLRKQFSNRDELGNVCGLGRGFWEDKIGYVLLSYRGETSRERNAKHMKQGRLIRKETLEGWVRLGV